MNPLVPTTGELIAGIGGTLLVVLLTILIITVLVRFAARKKAESDIARRLRQKETVEGEQTVNR